MTDINDSNFHNIDTLTIDNRSNADEPKLTLSMFQFVAVPPRKEPLPKDGVLLRRAKFSKWVKHQFAMKYRQEAPANVRDRSAFITKDGATVLELRYGTAQLKGLEGSGVTVTGDEVEFERVLLDAIKAGLFDAALEETATRKKERKSEKPSQH